MTHQKPKLVKRLTESVLFGSKWLLTPFYLGLIIALGFYTIYFFFELKHLIHVSMGLFSSEEHGASEVSNAILLGVLELVDITMIANLIKMIITGSYHSFVSKQHGEDSEKVSSGLLKVKMATSLVGVSSIHLLKSFINVSNMTMDDLTKQLIIHGSFLIGALILSWIDYIHVKSEEIEHGIEKDHGSVTH